MERQFGKFANATAKATGSPVAFLLCVLSVVIWGATGPVFRFSETWQLVINTGTTIQNTQNRDGAAIQTKLDELISASDAEDEFMGIEKLTDSELDRLHRKCRRMSLNSARLLEQAAAEQKARQASTARKTRPAGTPARGRPRAG